MNKRAKKNEVDFVILEEREMDTTEIETIASLLFNWWKVRYENQNNNESREGLKDARKNKYQFRNHNNRMVEKW